MRLLAITTISIALVLLAQTVFAAVPRQFTVQGVLRDHRGQLQSTTVDLTVALFDSSQGGTLLAGPYSGSSVPVDNGLFTFTIADAQLDKKITTATEIWIAVTVAGDVYARQRASTQLYALFAAAADGLTSACTGCVTDAMLAGGIDSKKIAGPVATANGGTGMTTAPSAAGQFLRSTAAGSWGVAALQPSDLPAGTVSSALPVAAGGSMYQLEIDVTGNGARQGNLNYCKRPSDILLNGGCWNDSFDPIAPAQSVGIIGDGTTTNAYWFCAWNNTTPNVIYKNTVTCYSHP
jgi:hypothetical protein